VVLRLSTVTSPPAGITVLIKRGQDDEDINRRAAERKSVPQEHQLIVGDHSRGRHKQQGERNPVAGTMPR
jgi:hypothetical protein